MVTTAELIDAVAFAADKHRNQRRRDAEAPCINHPIAPARVPLETDTGTTLESAAPRV